MDSTKCLIANPMGFCQGRFLSWIRMNSMQCERFNLHRWAPPLQTLLDPRDPNYEYTILATSVRKCLNRRSNLLKLPLEVSKLVLHVRHLLVFPMCFNSAERIP